MYFLFAGDTYYPGGGAEDCLGVFDSIDDAVAHAWHGIDVDGVQYTWDWYHIATVQDGKLVIVKRG